MLTSGSGFTTASSCETHSRPQVTPSLRISSAPHLTGSRETGRDTEAC